MTAPAGRALYFTTEFGCGLVLTVGATAAFLWSRRNQLAIDGGMDLRETAGPQSIWRISSINAHVG
jgi:hypothetical protein